MIVCTSAYLRQRLSPSFLVALCSVLTATSYDLCLAAEKPDLTLVFPSGGQLGTTVDVVATGKFSEWPMQIWSDTKAIEWSCSSESGKLQAKIGPDAKLGVHWIRLYCPSGATAVRPFLVGELPECNETEPNDRIAEVTSDTLIPQSIQAILNKRGDVDLYAVNLKVNELLVATVDSEKWLFSPADVSLQILDSKGFVLHENIDHVGLDPYLEFQALQESRYFVKVFGFPSAPDSSIGFSGGKDWVYRLRMTSRKTSHERAHDFALQSELDSEHLESPPGSHLSSSDAMTIPIPSRVKGTLAEPGQTTSMRFSAKANSNHRIRLLAREFGSPLDATLTVFDSAAKQLLQQDDIENKRDPVVKWKAPADGDFTLSISDFHSHGGPEYQFLLLLDELPASFLPKVANDLIQTTIGKEVEVAVDFERESDFQGPITVTVEGLPSSAICPAVESKHGTDTVSKVTLKITVPEAFQGPIQIVAKTPEAPNLDRIAQIPNHKPIWLSITVD